MKLETIVIVDGLNNLAAATAAAELSRPDHDLDYTIYGLSQCAELPQPDGGFRHVHAFLGDPDDMRPGMDKRKKYDTFGGYLYATPTPNAPYVRQHIEIMATLGEDARPTILKIG